MRDAKEFFDLKDAAEYLGLSTVQLRKAARKGRVTYSRLDRTHWRFLKRDLDSYIERNTFRAKTAFGVEK
jgi:excisionase family DNA binding protein